MNSPLRAMGGMPDHVHMIVSLAKTVALSDLMLNVKRDSSRWMSDNLQGPDRFAWQDGQGWQTPPMASKIVGVKLRVGEHPR